MASKHTTSIVDISEIEDDTPLGANTATTNNNNNNLASQQPQHQLGQQSRQASRSPDASQQMYLYHEDVHPQQRISSLLSNMANAQCAEPQVRLESSPKPTGFAGPALAAIDYPAYEGSDSARPFTPLVGARDDATRPNTPGATLESGAGAGGPKKANLGTLSGVYFPCVQNIFGVILFIRMVWIVGTAGVPAAFALVFICCCVTLTTSISLSAIATNGIVPAGGSYFMISRSLGPECGGAVGTMFFLGTTVAGAMYITGAVEIMLNYLAPSWGLFGDFQRDVSILYHNIRVYGSLLLVIVGAMVYIGVRFVSKLAPIALFCVLLSIFSIYAGIFINYNGRSDLMICVLGDRLVTLKNLPFDDSLAATNVQLALEQQYQAGANASAKLSPAQLEAQAQLRRSKALCTFEKLRYVFCPGELRPSAEAQEPSAYPDRQDRQEGSSAAADADQPGPKKQSQVDEAQLMRDIFRRQPNMSNCDPYFRANQQRIHLERAVPGIASGALWANLPMRFRQKGNVVSYDEGVDGAPAKGFPNVLVDITTSFTILISIYFPSCTGILAGSNRSGDLRDAQKSIPRGTIAAQLTTSFVYLSCILLFGATFNNLFIRDKFGESLGGQLAVTQIAWPHPYVILIGGLLSTLGASLQSLVGAPRILQGIAKDEVIPCFSRFAKVSARGEPEAAVACTLAIAWLAVLIGNLDFIAPILTLSLVMCYFFINLACTLHSLLGSPNWRPRFRHYHWSVSTLGCLLCLYVMIVSSLAYFLVAIFIAACIYKYIEFSGAEKEWGDGKQGLALSAARYNLLRLKTSEPHTKNWRPQLLLFCKLRQSAGQQQQSPAPHTQLAPHSGAAHAQPREARASIAHPKLLTLASQLKAGKGLTLVSSVIEGDFKQAAGEAARARQTLQDCMQAEKVKGFADVVVASSLMDGLSYQLQTAGLGGLKHNTVIVGWPERWRRTASQTRARQTRAHLFIELMRNVQVSQNALLVAKGADSWPESCDKLGGFIDVWWIVNDGGLLMLLPHLLRQHRTWKSCQLRIFTVAQANENSAQMRQDLRNFLYHLRIEAQVDIVEMNTAEISDYAYERTLMMEQRTEIIRRLNGNRKQSLLLEQEVDGRLIRFRIRKPSMGDFEDAATPTDQYAMVDLAGEQPAGAQAQVGAPDGQAEGAGATGGSSSRLSSARPDEANVRRMHTALSLNEAILQRSKSAKLVILNLPGAPKSSTPEAESNYMEFVEIITDKLERVLLVQNGGREVITIHS